MENKTEKIEAIQELFQNEDIQRMWMKMHTPWVLRHKKIGRNDLCPCGSGKKFKNCECYTKRFDSKYTIDEKHTKIWK